MKKRIISTMLALTMVASMSIPTFAATTDPNFTTAPGTAFSTPVTAGNSVTLKVGPANDRYVFSGYTSKTDAETKTKFLPIEYGDDIINEPVVTGATEITSVTPSGWASDVKVTAKSGTYGPASFTAYNDAVGESAYVDMTVYVEADAATDVADAEKVKVIVHNASTRGVGMNESRENLTVKPAEDSANNPFKGSAGAAQTYPTAADALYSLMDAGAVSFTQSGGYVSEITDSKGNKLEPYTSPDWTYYGWNYCIIRNKEIVPETEVMSASVVPVQEGDTVCWAYGTTDEASAYFKTLK